MGYKNTEDRGMSAIEVLHPSEKRAFFFFKLHYFFSHSISEWVDIKGLMDFLE